jgi:hypothetical protein
LEKKRIYLSWCYGIFYTIIVWGFVSFLPCKNKVNLLLRVSQGLLGNKAYFAMGSSELYYNWNDNCR